MYSIFYLLYSKFQVFNSACQWDGKVSQLWKGIETPQQTFQGTLVHEMTHTFQDANPDLEKQWAKTFWENGKPKSRSPSAYGNSIPIEDMAESIRAYWQKGEWMKAKQVHLRIPFPRKSIVKKLRNTETWSWK